ncbi:MAG: EAL domain-containing protein [Burkholderiaceae bacterium]|nr:EAL domain-containing protein [Burkholderiaceae bacterium]
MMAAAPEDSIAPVAPRLLIVEDESIVALDLRDNLETLGFSVVGVAASQASALRLVQRERPDLVLMDINLGRGGDGIQTAAVMRELVDVPVVYLTAYAESEMLRRASATVPYGYLLKPFELRELNATVRMALVRHQADRVVAQTQERLLLALDAAELGVMEFASAQDCIRLDGHHEFLSQSQLRGFCLPRDEFVAALDPIARLQLQGLLEPGQTLHCVAKWAPAGQRPVWLEINACHFKSENKVVGVFRDVSAKVRDEDKLRQAAVVFESAAEAILILDLHGAAVSVNRSFEKLTGWTQEEVRGRKPADFLHARRADDVLRDGAEADANGGGLNGEVTCKRKDGSMFPAWEHVSPVLDEAGQMSHSVMTFSDISALRRAEHRIHHLAFHDPLTGLGNRNFLDQFLREFQASTQLGERSGLGVLFIDLDGFKTINDTLGHAAGDQLLVAIARRLEGSLRSVDIPVRLGGDEFIVLTRHDKEQDASNLAEKLLDVIKLPVSLGLSEQLQVSASIGIALYPQHASQPELLIQAADNAMYEAKALGRNRFALFTQSLAQQSERRLRTEQGLRQAMGTQQLMLHWQPIVDARSGRASGAEALLRWTSPELGQVAPDRFIPVAEDCGFILELGRWVLEAAIAQFAAWQAQGLMLDSVSINVSVKQFKDDKLVAELARLLDQYQVAAGSVELEITESALLAMESAQRRLAELTALGVRVTLDDFGTGYSSLSLLKLLPLRRIKIDRSFVKDLERTPSDQEIVRAICSLAGSLSLEVVAEGVESAAQRDYLQSVGVDALQGIHFSAALGADEFADWLRLRGVGAS